jgi:hypothetical protein
MGKMLKVIFKNDIPFLTIHLVGYRDTKVKDKGNVPDDNECSPIQPFEMQEILFCWRDAHK